MRLKLFRVIFAALLCIVVAGVQIQAQYRSKCPEYMWSVAYLPVTYLGFKESPAAISWTGDGSNEIDGKYPVEIGFRNLSGKTIKALKFDWYLFYKDRFQNSQATSRAALIEEITLIGGKFLIEDTGEFKPQEEFAPRIKLPCEEIYEKVGDVDVRELLKTKNELIMEFVVTDISFADGSNWQRPTDISK